MISMHNFLIEYFSISSETSATLITTLFVFVSGLILRGLFIEVREYFTRRQIRKSLKFLVEQQINESLEHQKAFQEVSNRLRIENENSFQIKVLSIPATRNVKDIGFPTLYNAYFNGFENIIHCKSKKKLKRKAFFKLYKIMDYLETWNDLSFKLIHKYEGLYNDANEKRNIALAGYRQIIDQMLLIFNGKSTKNKALYDYFTELDAINFEWQQQQDCTKPNIVHENLVTPMLQLNRRNENEFAVRMNDFLLEADSQYKVLVNVLRIGSIQYNSASHGFRACSKHLSMINKIIS